MAKSRKSSLPPPPQTNADSDADDSDYAPDPLEVLEGTTESSSNGKNEVVGISDANRDKVDDIFKSMNSEGFSSSTTSSGKKGKKKKSKKAIKRTQEAKSILAGIFGSKTMAKSVVRNALVKKKHNKQEQGRFKGSGGEKKIVVEKVKFAGKVIEVKKSVTSGGGGGGGRA